MSSMFRNFNKSDIENKIFDSIRKPPIYVRFVDDILILANDIKEINILQSICQKIHFLTLLINLKLTKFPF